MSIKWIQCFDLQQSQHAAWVRADLVESVRVESPKAGSGETWQVYVDANGRSFRHGDLQQDRAIAIRTAENLIAGIQNG